MANDDDLEEIKGRVDAQTKAIQLILGGLTREARLKAFALLVQKGVKGRSASYKKGYEEVLNDFVTAVAASRNSRLNK